MSLTESKMLALGTTAPAFILPDTVTDKMISLNDYQNYNAYVIMFICNHCPYVVHVNPEIVKLSNEYQNKGVTFIAINSNDAMTYPQDGPEPMKIHALNQGYSFPYLFDATQQVAKDYDAACTPDFYVFDKNKSLVYRGRLDDSRPNSGIQLSGKDLRQALDNVLAGREVPNNQYPSMGCNIKWKGN